MPKNPHNVYHGYDGLAKNPQASPELKAYAKEQMAQVSNKFHGSHGAYHNPSSSEQAKSNAMRGMQQTQPDAWKNR